MKKLFIILMLLITPFLYGCDPGVFYFDYSAMKNNTSTIEWICYNNYLSKMVKIGNDTTLIFDNEKIISIKQLDSTQVDGFLKELSKITFHLVNRSALEPVNECLKITKQDSSFIILSCTVIDDIGYSMVAEFDSNGIFLEHLAHFADRKTFEKIINKYFQ